MERVIIVGGGLVGSLLSMFLARRGYAVAVMEKKAAPGTSSISSGRSINLTLCHRGLEALSRIGIEEAVRSIAVPVYGRVIHGLDGTVAFQPYGNHGEALHSVTRAELNKLLLRIAARSHGVEIHFRRKCIGIDLSVPTVTFQDLDSGEIAVERAAAVLGTDGAFSAVRLQLQKTDRFNYSQEYTDQGYKELDVSVAAAQAWGLEGRYTSGRAAVTCSSAFRISTEASL